MAISPKYVADAALAQALKKDPEALVRNYQSKFLDVFRQKPQSCVHGVSVLDGCPDCSGLRATILTKRAGETFWREATPDSFVNGSEIAVMGVDYAPPSDKCVTVEYEWDARRNTYVQNRMIETSANYTTVTIGIASANDLTDVRQSETEQGVYRVKRKARKTVARGLSNATVQTLSSQEPSEQIRRIERDKAAGRATQVTMQMPSPRMGVDQ